MIAMIRLLEGHWGHVSYGDLRIINSFPSLCHQQRIMASDCLLWEMFPEPKHVYFNGNNKGFTVLPADFPMSNSPNWTFSKLSPPIQSTYLSIDLSIPSIHLYDIHVCTLWCKAVRSYFDLSEFSVSFRTSRSQPSMSVDFRNLYVCLINVEIMKYVYIHIYIYLYTYMYICTCIM